jgi:hypothetical protein
MMRSWMLVLIQLATSWLQQVLMGLQEFIMSSLGLASHSFRVTRMKSLRFLLILKEIRSLLLAVTRPVDCGQSIQETRSKY